MNQSAEENYAQAKINRLQTLFGFKEIDPEFLKEQSEEDDFKTKFMANMLKKTIVKEENVGEQVQTDENEVGRKLSSRKK